MAVSAKIFLKFHPVSELDSPRPRSFVSRNDQLPTKRSHRNSLLSFGSSFTSDPNPYLSQLCIQSELKEAITFLNSAGKEIWTDIEEETFISLVRLCEFKRAYDEGSFIYSLVSGFFSSLSLRLGNSLLSMFVRLGNLNDAWYVFGKMNERDLFSWNVLIGGYAKNGFFEDSMDLYARMLWLGNVNVRPDVYTFPCILRACGGLENWSWGREIHAHLLRYGYEDEVDVINALISMYVKCGDLRSGRIAFGGLKIRDRISWNAMISGYFENGECIDGLKLFFSMRESGFYPDLMTMTSVVSSCEVLGDEMFGRAVHGYVAKTEYAVADAMCNSLIQMYSSFGRWAEAENIFSRIEYKDVVSWTSMISGYSNNGQADKAIHTYLIMEAEAIEPDEITIACVLSACSSLGLLDIGTRLHDLAKRTGMVRHLLVANALIDFYSKCKCILEALKVFNQIPEKNIFSWSSIILGLHINDRSFDALMCFCQMKNTISPNAITLISVLSACGKVGSLMCGKEIHAYALRNGLAFDGFLPNSLLSMYMRCGKMKLAKNQFKTVKQDPASWNIFLTGHAQKGRGKLVIKLFNRMLNSGVQPDEITFVALLCACSRSRMVSEGLEYFNIMRSKYHISPNVKHYACLVDLMGRSGRLEDAYEIIQNMPMKPDAAVWGALLNACRIHKRVNLGEIAARHIFGMDNRSVGYYILLCNIYCESGKWDEVHKLRMMMRDMGLTIDPGCSWIEVKGKTHAFLTGDNFHPQIREITTLLAGLYNKMNSKLPSDEVEAKANIFCGHSERLAVAFGLINVSPGIPIRITKNLYMCKCCHDMMKYISRSGRREIFVRDTENFHHFNDGSCSCGDEGFWGYDSVMNL